MAYNENILFNEPGAPALKSNRGTKFIQSIRLSLLIHICLVFILVLTQRTAPSREFDVSKDMDAFMQAYQEASAELDMDSVFENMDEAFKKMKGKGLLGLNLSHNEKVQFYKQLFRVIAKGEYPESGEDSPVESILKSLRAGGVELDSGDKVFPGVQSPESGELQFETLPKAEQETLKRLKRWEDLERDNVTIQGGKVIIDSESGLKYIPTEYYFRKSPYEAILAQGSSLFYIMSGFPLINLQEEEETPSDETNEIDHSLIHPMLFRDTRFVLIQDASPSHVPPQRAESIEAGGKEILRMNVKRVQEILDGLMTFNEIRQLDFFVDRYLLKFDPDQGMLPHLTHEFIHNNLANLIIVYHPIAGAYGFIEQIYFNRPLDEIFHGYYLSHPDSQTSVELLFTLASHINFEKRAIQYLFDAYEEARRVSAKNYYKTDIYNKRVKAYIIKEIYESLRSELSTKGYQDLDDILFEYSFQERLIYETVIARGGRDEMRGLYALGALYWEDEIFNSALETWEKIDSGYDDPGFNKIRRVLTCGDDLAEIIPRINRILSSEANKGNRQLLERLLKYNRWANRLEEEGGLI
jgi:hypothetical protein